MQKESLQTLLNAICVLTAYVFNRKTGQVAVSNLKNSTIFLIAVCSFAAVSTLTFIPIKAREWVMVLVWGWTGVLYLGYAHKPWLFSIVLTAAYQSLGMTLARYFAGKWPAKGEAGLFEVAWPMFLAALILNGLLWCLGKRARRFMDRRKQTSSP